MKKIITTVTIDDSGKVIEQNVRIEAMEDDDIAIMIDDTYAVSVYGKVFDSYCNAWNKNRDYNLMFIRHQEEYLNSVLKARGHVFLNEAYDVLGLERTRLGTIAGWTSDKHIEITRYISDNSEISDVILDFNAEKDITWVLK